MKVFLFSIFLTAMCDSPAPPTVYDAGDATCVDAWKVAQDCEGFDLLGPDELPDSGDELDWVEWCEEFQASGIERIDTGCIANADGCAAALECMEH